MTALLGAALAAGAVLLGTARRPVPARVAELRVRPAATPARAAWVPGLAIGLLTVVVPPLGLLAGGGFGLTRWFRARRRTSTRHRDDAVVRCLPEVIDLVSLATTAGHPLADALGVAGAVLPPILAPGLAAVIARIAAGDRLDQAVTSLTTSWGDGAAPLVHVLSDHLRYGTPLVPGLERLAADSRSRRRRVAEAEARRLPVLLLFPLVACVLPAFGLLTVAPLLAGTLGSLELGPLETSVSPSNPTEGSAP